MSGFLLKGRTSAWTCGANRASAARRVRIVTPVASPHTETLPEVAREDVLLRRLVTSVCRSSTPVHLCHTPVLAMVGICREHLEPSEDPFAEHTWLIAINHQ